ncbi:type III-B CRISPR module-associated protein Cmr5 (plasmid) [Arcobacter cryaerophilus gv. pseudocryaerophilus]|uniref:CRISPR type III-B/RAMP module-associated protein Cmr5 n=3 Tax=Arcobacteraceae TaxID=2808963 RepID=A0AA96DX58_9BACT|nr:type III-B CRISPR module-associated protein Cmr5 [Aliarcobacter cryaerophilus]MCT7535972.1 hypothetical protein [Aliarcobacter cryaerophilus]WNL35158.1 type III-B CRISPR module-associated protein Cmr5 [Arcobacter sp. AZ-2023]WNL37345.1 type III-B CRISPR module-associated protein Cmr5 [Arcobacter sp. AZ-2023]WPD13060.1 type III-B CRISPR module-associated protein Cmr5 [Arcobacter sp. DSM 115960]
MSKKRIEDYIPKAIELLNKEFPDGKISKAYNGYISSFGASIIQSGLKPTLAVFENTNSSTLEDKSYLTQLILKLLLPNLKSNSLLKYVLENKDKEEALKNEIIDIAIALKLSIRTFNLG